MLKIIRRNIMSKNLKKVLVASASLLMLASVGASANNVNVNARHRRTHRVYRHRTRYWYKGIPKIMRGKWHAGRHGRGETKIYRNYIDEFHRYAPVDDEDISHMHFHYQGHGKYLIKGYVHNAAVSNRYYHITLHAKVYNHHKMYYSGIRHGRFSDSAVYTKY